MHFAHVHAHTYFARYVQAISSNLVSLGTGSQRCLLAVSIGRGRSRFARWAGLASDPSALRRAKALSWAQVDELVYKFDVTAPPLDGTATPVAWREGAGGRLAEGSLGGSAAVSGGHSLALSGDRAVRRMAGLSCASVAALAVCLRMPTLIAAASGSQETPMVAQAPLTRGVSPKHLASVQSRPPHGDHPLEAELHREGLPSPCTEPCYGGCCVWLPSSVGCSAWRSFGSDRVRR